MDDGCGIVSARGTVSLVADLDRSKAFTRASARHAGLGWRALGSTRYRRLFRGVYVCAALSPCVATSATAAITASGDPEAVASHHTAALLWGGVVPHSTDVHVTVPTGHTRRRTDGLRVHSGERTAYLRRRIRVTSAADTFLDLAGCLGLVDLVVLGDSLVKAGAVTPEQLRDAMAATKGRGARLARRAADLVRAGVDSPMETKTRLLMVLAGLPEPVVNHVLRHDDGEIRRRLDLAYPWARLAIEYDGRQHAESPKQWQGDVRRREELDGDGWRLVVLLAPDIYRTPRDTLARIRAAMSQCGMQVPPASDAWRQYFPDASAA